MLSNTEQKIWDLILPCVNDFDLRLVRVKYMTTPNQRSTLQVMIEPAESCSENRLSVNVDQCAEVSRAIAAILDVEDPISEAYNLEVSSTGINRPLVALSDFEIYVDNNVKIELNQSLDGQKRFTAKINNVDTNSKSISITELETDKSFTIPYSVMKKASLYYTQEEIKKLF